jgi:hypothetical protein
MEPLHSSLSMPAPPLLTHALDAKPCVHYRGDKVCPQFSIYLLATISKEDQGNRKHAQGHDIRS